MPVGCTVDPNTTTLLEDLSTNTEAGSNGMQFQHLLFIVTANIGDGVYVLAQKNSEDSDFTMYQVSFGQRSANSMTLGSAQYGGVRLLDVRQTPKGPAALTSYTTQQNSPQQALEIVSLPATWGGAAGTITPVSPVILNGSYPNGATFVSPVADVYYWILAAQQSGVQGQILTGSSNMDVLTLLQSPTGNYNANVPFLDMNRNLYAVAQGLSDAGGSTVLAYPDSLDDAGVQAPVAATSPFSAVLTAHVSAIDPMKVALAGISLDQTTGNGQVWAGRVNPASMTSLTLGPPQFAAGSVLAINELPFDNGGTALYGDHLFSVGTAQGGSNSLLLVWIGPEGRAIAHRAVMGPLITRSNVIRTSAIGVNQAIGEVDAGLFVAWIEEKSPTPARATTSCGRRASRARPSRRTDPLFPRALKRPARTPDRALTSRRR